LATLRLKARLKAITSTVIVQNVSKSVLAGQRIGILRRQGKSTLVKR
jgi:ATPase subunit of ABC transporter with duplicated ATPase domains